MPPDDYEAVSDWSLVFPVCATVSCVNITTINDSLLEGDETFRVTLSRAPDLHKGIRIGRDTALVTIADDDGEGIASYIVTPLDSFSC